MVGRQWDRQKKKKEGKLLHIIKYPWHTGHDYELAKLDARFSLLYDTHRRWDVGKRPIPSNVSLITDKRSVTADLMMLHVDQWTFGQIDKRQLFLYHRKEFDGPIVVINHGTNMVDGCSSEAMQELVGDLPVVCNSPTALSLWGLKNSVYIRHGMSPEEWPKTNYGRASIVVTQPPPGLHDECRNGTAVVDFEKRENVKVDWIGRDRHFTSFDRYVKYLTSSSIFFNPSYASANPRSRTEAMLCGLAVVTTNSHDESEYIVNGENGYASNDMNELYEFLEYLVKNPGEARRLGKNGRKTAQQVFHIDRFRRRWEAVLGRVMSGSRIDDLRPVLTGL